MNLRKFKFTQCIPLQDSHYFVSLLSELQKAQKRIWINFYYVNILPDTDKNYLTREIFEIIKRKKEDGLNVKVFLGTNDFETQIDINNRVVYSYLLNIGVPCKLYNGYKKFSHSKYILIDKEITILGSHNLSDRSLTTGTDDSIFIQSTELAQFLSNDFLKIWK